jgi:hypothetical protein
MALSCVVAPCSLVEVYRRFRGACFLRQVAEVLIMEAVNISEKSVHLYKTTRRNNSKDSHLHTSRRENLISHLTTYL